MALSATPDIAEITAAIRSNSLYAINASLTEAKDFIEAVTAYLTLPRRGVKGQEEYELSHSELAKLLEKAEQWYASRSGNKVVYYATRHAR